MIEAPSFYRGFDCRVDKNDERGAVRSALAKASADLSEGEAGLIEAQTQLQKAEETLSMLGSLARREVEQDVENSQAADSEAATPQYSETEEEWLERLMEWESGEKEVSDDTCSWFAGRPQSDLTSKQGTGVGGSSGSRPQQHEERGESMTQEDLTKEAGEVAQNLEKIGLEEDAIKLKEMMLGTNGKSSVELEGVASVTNSMAARLREHGETRAAEDLHALALLVDDVARATKEAEAAAVLQVNQEKASAQVTALNDHRLSQISATREAAERCQKQIDAHRSTIHRSAAEKCKQVCNARIPSP